MNNPSLSQKSVPSPDVVKQLSDLFTETGHTHHEAFSEVDGKDPDWPLWYAEHLHEPLGEHLRAMLTKAELVYMLVLADKEHNLRAPGARWPRYYARFFVERYM